MVAGSLDVERFFRRSDAVAAVAAASELFGILRRSIDLPGGWTALATRRTGDLLVQAPGTALVDNGLSEVLFVRAMPVDVHCDVDGLASSDRFECSATVHLRVTPIAEKSELASLREAVLGSGRTLLATGLGRYLEPHVRTALESFAGGVAAAELVERFDRAAIERLLRTELQAPTFAAGLELPDVISIEFSSPAYSEARMAELEESRRRQRAESERQLAESRAASQRAHVEHLSGLLARLDELVVKSPSMKIGDLVRTFADAERGQLYQALFAASTPAVVTEWIVVAAGNELLYFDPRSTESPARRISLDSPAGGLRSVQLATLPDGLRVLLVGAGTGVHVVPVDAGTLLATCTVPQAGSVRGGFNSVALFGERILATHSELGLWVWNQHIVAAPVRLLESQTRAAKSVRDVQVYDGRIYLSVDDRVLVLSTDAAAGNEPLVLTGSSSAITALHATSAGVFAGTSEGQVLGWDMDPNGTIQPAPRILRGATRRPVESLARLEHGGVARIFYADSSPSVEARVIGDAFTCEYLASGQILRRASVAADCVVATVDGRDRLVCWKLNQPDRPSAVIPISRLTGRSIQDVCLIPANAEPTAA